MSQQGIHEFLRWGAEVLTTFTRLPPVRVTDDLVPFTTLGGFPATAQYQFTQPPACDYKITPMMVPGRALVWHELEHAIFEIVMARVGGQHGRAYVRAAFVARGFDPALVDANEGLAKEQMASMLPEAFIGEWGGYIHPLWGLDPVTRDAKVREFFASDASARMRAFFLGYETWSPPAQPIVVPPAPVAPTPAPTAPTLPELAPIYYSQWDPDHVGSGDCVPTSAKMLVRYYTGREIAIAAIRDAMDLVPDGVRNLARDAGVTLEAARAALTNVFGVPCTAVLARDLDLTQLLNFVRAGRLPIVFELHGDLPTRMDQAFRGLHAVWLTAVDGGMLEVKDPDRSGPNKADRWLVAISDFARAYLDGAVLGGGAVIPNEPRKGWDDDMAFTDDDRRKLNRIYDHLEAYEPLVWIKRLQQWLGKAFRTMWPNADLSGPDVESGQPFK